MSQLLSTFPLWSLLYLREFLWNTLGEFPRYLPLILRYKSLISIDSQRRTEIVFIVHLRTLHKISNSLLTSEKKLDTGSLIHLSQVCLVNTRSFIRCFFLFLRKVCRRRVIPIQWQSCVNKSTCKPVYRKKKKDKNVIVRLRVGPYREKLWPRAWKCCPRPMGKTCDRGLENAARGCGLAIGQHIQDLGHSFSLYGPPSRPITYITPLESLRLRVWLSTLQMGGRSVTSLISTEIME